MMSFEYTDIIVKWSEEYRKFILINDCRITYKYPIVAPLSRAIPRGFRTDFGSIPAIFRPIFNPIGKEVPCYLFHDYLCYLSNVGKFDRNEADKLLLDSLKCIGTSPYRRYMIYIGVRCISFKRKLQKIYMKFIG